MTAASGRRLTPPDAFGPSARLRPTLRRAPRCVSWAPVLVLALNACVVVEERLPAPQPIRAVPMAIPFSDTGEVAGPSDDYYRSVVEQMQHAWLHGERERLGQLLAAHGRDDAPAWASERMAGFERVVRAMEFEDAVRGRGQLELPSPLPALGEPLQLTVRLGPLPSFAVRLLGGDDPARARFVLGFRMTDHDGLGDTVENATSTVVDLPRTIDFAAGDSVQVPVGVEVPAAGSVLRRVAIDVFLMPGHVEIDGVRLPTRQVRCCTEAIELLPRGHEHIAEKPLATLRAALRLGDAAHFGHVFLAARALAMHGSEVEREAGLAALVDHLRLGNAGQARCAQAGLELLVPSHTARRYAREDWLRWWGERATMGR